MTEAQPQPNHTRFLRVDCVKCDHVVENVLLENFMRDNWEKMGWEFGIFSQRGSGMIIESPTSASLTGICPKCPK